MSDALPIVYVETSVVSYLAAPPNRDLVIASHQRVTAEWWQDAARRFTLVVTWNLRHLAGAIVRRRIEQALRDRRINPPTICTPEELLPTLPPSGAPDV